MASLLLATPVVLAAAEPTRTGDPIGSVKMLGDGTLSLHLRSVQCDGRVAESQTMVRRDQPNYQDLLDHVGRLGPSEEKTVRAWPVAPCSAK
jgi:hypothetical protein